MVKRDKISQIQGNWKRTQEIGAANKIKTWYSGLGWMDRPREGHAESESRISHGVVGRVTVA